PPDALLLRLGVELLLGAATRTAMRSEPPAAARRDVARRRTAPGARLTRARPLLVHGAGGDLLGDIGGAAVLLQALLDVAVLTLTLLAPCLLGHAFSSSDLPLGVVPERAGD